MVSRSTTFKRVKLGDIAKVVSGHAFRSKDFGTEGVPVIKIKNIRVGHVDLSDVDFIDPSYMSLPEKYHVNGGDLLISLTGSHLTQPNSVVGRVALHSPALGSCLLNQRAGKIILKSAKDCDSKYLFYALYTWEKRQEIAQMAAGAASQANVSPTQVERVEINLPPLKTQHKIASILSTYDDLIENNTWRIKILEEMAQTIYREWFVNFRFPGHEKVKMVDSPLGKIPEGWEVVELGDIAQELRRSIDPTSLDPETPYVGLEHIPRKSITLNDWGYAKDIQSTKLAFCKGEILFGKIRPYFHKVSIAPLDGISSSDTIVISARKPELEAMVLGCVSSVEFVSYATQTSQGTKMPRANWKVLVSYPVALPSRQLLEQFNGIMDNVVKQTGSLMFKNQNLRQTRDLLLPKLISGEIDVSELDIAPRETAA